MMILYFILLQTSQIANSQPSNNSPAAKYYIYVGETGELQLKVSIWGEIGSPGLYAISEDVDLATLISLAGGPTESANLSNIKIMRSFPSPEVIKVNMNHFFKTGDRKGIPFLRPGDMVKVNTTLWNKAYKFTRWVTETSIMVGVYIQLYNLITNLNK